MKRLLLLLILTALKVTGEGFESLPLGEFEKIDISLGTVVSKKGDAVVHGAHAKQGQKSLRLMGGERRAVEIILKQPLGKKSIFSFWAERWTARKPFSFVVEAKAQGVWSELYRGDRWIRVGGFLTLVEIPLEVGVTSLRLRTSTPDETGLMIDELQLEPIKPMSVSKVTAIQPVVPVLLRKEVNPLLGLKIVTEGRSQPKVVTKLWVDFDGSTELAHLESAKVLFSGGQSRPGSGELFGVLRREGEAWICEGSASLLRGDNFFWVSAQLGDQADLDGQMDGRILKVEWSDGSLQVPEVISPEGTQRIGYAVRLRGDDGSSAYRIPGMVQTQQGSLIAVYDVRWRGGGDLPGDIDVGMSRSVDQGQSWEKMKVILDMGNNPKWRYDGVGDPAILVDRMTGRIWVVATWSHGNRSWNGSGQGMTPEQTGQVMMCFSDDDGITWSDPINITRQVKDPQWHFILQGPGSGITMKDGTLVFAAQFQAGPRRTPYSSILYSRDRGQTWKVGKGVKSNTTEAQVVELSDGSLMLNCRDNRGGARTVAVTHDLGASWELHPTDRKALPEPVCMASLLRFKDQLLFSNPNTTKGRYNMTIKLSRDEGMTWPQAWHHLYDERLGNGYSSLAPIGDEQIGVLYEGVSELYFLRFSLKDLLSSQ